MPRLCLRRYAFGDEHINNIIYQALTVPTFRLIVFADPKAEGEIAKLRDLGDPRIWIIGGAGAEGGAPAHYFNQVVEHFLPQRPPERIEAAVKKVLEALGSGDERALFMQSEVDTDVVDYRAQPFRFEFVSHGQKRTYIVDCVRLLSDGTIEVVEVKHDARSLRDPDYTAKLQAVRLICERVGWRFRVVLQKALRTSRAFDDIVDIQSWRFTDFGQADVYCAATAIGRGVTSLGNLAEALCRLTPSKDLFGSKALAVAKLKAMVVKRVVRLDLANPLSLQTKVALVADPSEVLQ